MDIYAHALVIPGNDHGVAGQGFLVPVKGQTHQFAPSVQNRRTGVSAGDVVVREEVDNHVLLRAGQDGGKLVVVRKIVPGHIPFLYQAADRGFPGTMNAVPRLQGSHPAVRKAHGGIGIRILGNAHFLAHGVEGPRVFFAQVGKLVAVLERMIPFIERAGSHIFHKADQRVVFIQLPGYHRFGAGKEGLVPEIFGQGGDVAVELLHQLALIGSVEGRIHAGKVFRGRIDQQIMFHTGVGFRQGTAEFLLFVPGISHPHDAAGEDHPAEQGFAEVDPVGLDHGVPADEGIRFLQQVSPAGLARRIRIDPCLQPLLFPAFLLHHAETAPAQHLALVQLLDIA